MMHRTRPRVNSVMHASKGSRINTKVNADAIVV
jgi:hypothetical protein